MKKNLKKKVMLAVLAGGMLCANGAWAEYVSWYGHNGTPDYFVNVEPDPAVLTGLDLTIKDNTDFDGKTIGEFNADDFSCFYGGYTTADDVDVNGNSITVNTNNATTISAAMIISGYSDTGDVSNNTVTIYGGEFAGSLSSFCSIYGGYSVNSSAKNNSMIIYGGIFNCTSEGSIYGGSSGENGDATGNIVTINGGTFNENTYIYGGCGNSATGTASNNIVTIKGGTFNGAYIYGGGSGVTGTTGTDAGTTLNNTVTINGGTFNGAHIYGGAPGNYGDATGNIVTINGGTFSNVELSVGVKTDGTSSDNTLNINTNVNGTFSVMDCVQNMNFTVPANMDKEMPMLNVKVDTENGFNGLSLSGITFTTNLNDLSLTGTDYITLVKGVDGTVGTFTDSDKYHVLTFGDTKELVYSKGTPVAKADFEITTNGEKSAVGDKYYSDGESETDTIANTNKTYEHPIQGNVNLTNGTDTTNYSNNEIIFRRGTYSGYVFGAELDSGVEIPDDVTNNKLTIYGGTFEAYVYGGSNSYDGCDAIGNSVTIYDGTFSMTVVGGNVRSGIASENTVTIYNGTFNDTWIYGGFGGSPINNSVIINGGNFSAGVEIYGGNGEGGDATGNIVTINGGTFEDGYKLYGGDVNTSGKTSSGNVLNLKTKIGGKAAEVKYFQELNFTLPSGITAGDKMLSVTNAVSLDGVAVNVYLNGYAGEDTITLIDNATGTGTYKVYTNTADGTGDNKPVETSDYTISFGTGADVSKLLLKYNITEVTWYTVGSTEKKFADDDTVRSIGESGTAVTGDVVLYRGTKTNNEYGLINVDGTLTVGDTNDQTGKSFLVSGVLTATGGVTVLAKNSLTIDPDNLKSAVTNQGTVRLQDDGILGVMITGGTIDVISDVSSNVSYLAGAVTNASNTLTLTGGAEGSSVVLGGNISGNGTTVVNGHVSTGDKTITQNVLTINASASFTTEVDALVIENEIENNGTLTLTADGTTPNTLEEAVTGDSGKGTLNVNGTMTISGNVTQNSVVIDSGKTLTMTGTMTAPVTVGSSAKLIIDASKLAGTVANSGIVDLGAGELASGKTITGGTLNIKGDVTANASDIAGTSNVVDSGKTLTLNGGTLGGAVTGDGTLKVIDNTITADASYIGAKTNTVEDGANLTLIGTNATLSKAIDGAGDIDIGDAANAASVTSVFSNFANEGDLLIAANSTLLTSGNINKDVSGIGTVQLNGATSLVGGKEIKGILNGGGQTVTLVNSDTAKTNTIDTFTVGTLTGTLNIGLDVDMFTFTSDKLAVTTLDGSVVVNSINITKDIVNSPLELPNTENNKIVFLTKNAGSGTTSVKNSTITVTNNYKYTFTAGDTGKLNYKVEAHDLTFKGFMEGTLPDYTTQPTTLSLTDNLVNSGTGSDAITQAGDRTINLNGHTLSSSATSTIEIGSGKTLTLNGGNEASDGIVDANTNFSVAGTMNISGKATINGTLGGTGTYTNSGTLTIADASKLQMTNGLANTGILNLGGATASALGADITGTEGTTNIIGQVSSAKSIENNLVIKSTGDFTSTGTISGVVENNNKFTVNGGSVDGDVTNNCIMNVTGGNFGAVTNNNEVNFTGAASGLGVINKGKMKVTAPITVSSATFAAGSTLTLDASKCVDAAIINRTGKGLITVAPTSVLCLEGAVKKTVYKIVSGVDSTFLDNDWDLSNIQAAGLKVSDVGIVGDVYQITFKSCVPENTMLKNLLADGSDNKLIDWAEGVTDKYGDSETMATNEINAMATLGENLGVTRGALDVTKMVGAAVTDHLNDKQLGYEDEDSNAYSVSGNAWARLTHNRVKVDGLHTGDMKAQYSAQYNGVSVGYDLVDDQDITMGVALHYADGNTSNGFGGHNDGTYTGGSVYAQKLIDKIVVSGDVTYIHGKNEMDQAGVSAKASTNTISAGFDVRRPIKVGKGYVTPFAGMRYSHVQNKGYTDSLGVNRSAGSVGNFVTPVGVRYSVNIDNFYGWTLQPFAEIGYLFSFGDKGSDMKLRYGGVEDAFGFNVVDKNTFFTRAGMNFGKKNMTAGVGYDYMKSSNSHNNRWNVNLTWSF